MNAICDGGGWGCGSDIYTNYFYLKKEKPMDAEQEEGPDVAMDAAMDNDEVGDPEEPLLLLPKFWSQEEKDGVENMLANKDESLRRLAQRIVETWSGDGICTRGRMTINKTGRDQYGTFTFEACGGFNYSLSRNAPYYFNQIATMMMFAKNWGVKLWPIKMKFDVADDLWTAEFGIDFNFDDNIAFNVLQTQHTVVMKHSLLQKTRTTILFLQESIGRSHCLASQMRISNVHTRVCISRILLQEKSSLMHHNSYTAMRYMTIQQQHFAVIVSSQRKGTSIQI